MGKRAVRANTKVGVDSCDFGERQQSTAASTHILGVILDMVPQTPEERPWGVGSTPPSRALQATKKGAGAGLPLFQGLSVPFTKLSSSQLVAPCVSGNYPSSHSLPHIGRLPCSLMVGCLLTVYY